MLRGVTDISHSSAVYQHCMATYEMMEREATDATWKGKPVKFYEGFLTRQFEEELGLSLPYYSKITAELRRMGSIEQIKRGGGKTPSQWILHNPPGFEDYLQVGTKEYRGSGPRGTQNLAAMEEKYRKMAADVQEIKEMYKNMAMALLNITTQLETHEQQLNEGVS